MSYEMVSVIFLKKKRGEADEEVKILKTKVSNALEAIFSLLFYRAETFEKKVRKREKKLFLSSW